MGPIWSSAKTKNYCSTCPAAVQYAAPRNIIIQYEAVQVRIVRQFQRLGVTPENPQAYIARYGASLFDANTLLQQARAAGVIEDISPPAVGFSAQSYGQESSFQSSGSGFEGGLVGQSSGSGFEGGAIALGGPVGAAGSSYESSSFESSSGGGYGGAAGFETGAGFAAGGELAGAEFGGGGAASSSYEASSYSSSAGY